ncbi:hypothetical protein BGLY_2274 [Bacillus glycinifermentans]|nr:hypothetical protein BGLY_2274 [Bacillus glycinifermentans]
MFTKGVNMDWVVFTLYQLRERTLMCSSLFNFESENGCCLLVSQAGSITFLQKWLYSKYSLVLA